MTSRAQLVAAVSNLQVSDQKKEAYYEFIGTQTEDQCATILLIPGLQNRVTNYVSTQTPKPVSRRRNILSSFSSRCLWAYQVLACFLNFENSFFCSFGVS